VVLQAGVFSPDGSETLRFAESAPADRAGELGRRVAEGLRDAGAERILGPLREAGEG
jgi:porphobilinogen deaminase